MSIGLQGKNLIFLISQPRAGSTLLQRILGSHPDIHTESEPWLMLHPLYGLRSDGYQAEYNAHLARVAVQGFLQMLPDGEGEYFEGLRRMYSYLYGRALASSGKRYFLDKTPRYYLIISELYRIFPKAHCIILLRNPLAVLCSGLRTWTKERWLSLHNRKHDLTEAPRLLLAGIDMLGERGVVVHYEQLVRDPKDEVRRICDGLGVDFVPGMIEYGRHDLPRWQFGDQEKVYHHTRPASRNEEKWTQALGDPQIWRLAGDYLQLLGQETVEQMGYPYEKLLRVLETHRPHPVSLRFTFSLAWLLEKPVEERNMWDRLVVRLARSLQGRRSRGTVVAAIRKVAHALSNPE
jgi:hypothetical protein